MQVRPIWLLVRDAADEGGGCMSQPSTNKAYFSQHSTIEAKGGRTQRVRMLKMSVSGATPRKEGSTCLASRTGCCGRRGWIDLSTVHERKVTCGVSAR